MALSLWDRMELDWPRRWLRFMDIESSRTLRVEEFSEDGTLVIRAEVPGVDPEHDVKIEVSEGTLHIEVHREEKAERRDKQSYTSEFRYGELVRDLSLPAGVQADTVQATYTDGILEVRVPWPAEKRSVTTKVPVSHS